MTGLQSPNTTPVPNDIFDLWADLSDIERAIIVPLCGDKNVGVFRFHGRRGQPVTASLTDLELASQLSRPSVIEAIRRLMARGLLARWPHGQSYRYGFVFEDAPTSKPDLPATGKPRLLATGKPDLPVLVNPVYQSRGAPSIELKKEYKKRRNEPPAAVAAVGSKKAPAAASLTPVETLYRDEIGKLTPELRRQLGEFVTRHGEILVTRAIREAVAANVLKLAYIRAVLEPRAKPARTRVAGEDWRKYLEGGGEFYDEP